MKAMLGWLLHSADVSITMADNVNGLHCQLVFPEFNGVSHLMAV